MGEYALPTTLALYTLRRFVGCRGVLCRSRVCTVSGVSMYCVGCEYVLCRSRWVGCRVSGAWVIGCEGVAVAVAVGRGWVARVSGVGSHGWHGR